MILWLEAEGASEEQIQRGIAAAEAVFQAAGVTPVEAAEGRFALEGWDIAGFPDDGSYTEEDARLADIWFEADEAATEACFEGQPDAPGWHSEALCLLPGIPVPDPRLMD